MLPILFPLIVDHMRIEIIIRAIQNTILKTKHVQTIPYNLMVGKPEGDIGAVTRIKCNRDQSVVS